MAVIAQRRYTTPSGQVFSQFLFGLGTFALTIDTILRSEAQTRQSTDSLVVLEGVNGPVIDAVVRSESIGRLSADSQIAIENAPAQVIVHGWPFIEALSRSTQSDIVVRAEANANLTADALARIETLQLLQGIDRIPTEADARLAADVMARTEVAAGNVITIHGLVPIESIGRLIADVLVQNEKISILVADINPRAENLSSAAVVADAAGRLETLNRIQSDSSIREENLSGAVADILLKNEALGLAGILIPAIAKLETQARQQIDSQTPAEFVSAIRIDANGAIISLVGIISREGIAQFEALGQSVSITDAMIPLEMRLQLVADQQMAAEAGAGLIAISRSPDEAPVAVIGRAAVRSESLGSATASIDAMLRLESAVRGVADSALIAESGSRQVSDSPGFLESGAGLSADAQVPLKLLANLLADANLGIESGSRVVLTADSLAQLEISGTSIGFDLPVLVLESGAVLRIDSIDLIENKAILTTLNPVVIGSDDGSAPVPGPFNVLSIGRVRILSVPYTALQLAPFDPIRPEEIDNFAFDFTNQAAAATIISTSWKCEIAAGSTGDDVAQARILRAGAFTTIYTETPTNTGVQTWNGAFSVAIIGTFPETAIGATFILSATVTLSDARILTASSSVLCRD